MLQIATRGGKDMVGLMLRRGADKNKNGGLTGVPMCISQEENAVEIAEIKGFNDIARVQR